MHYGSVLQVFAIVAERPRSQVEEVVGEQDVNLGMVDPTSGRSLLFMLLTGITNGDRMVLGERRILCKVGFQENWMDVSQPLVVRRMRRTGQPCLTTGSGPNMALLVGASWTRTPAT